MSRLNKFVGLVVALFFPCFQKVVGCNDAVLELSALPSRRSNYSEQDANNMISDKELVSAWYRTTLDGRLFLLSDSHNVTYGNCGTFYPIYSQDLHPIMSTLTSDISVIKACQYDHENACKLDYNIPVRRCHYEVQYYLDPTIPYAAYCFDIQCVQGLYGEDCEHKCQCVEKNTAYCYPDNGDCECKPGWSGSICNADVDECASSDLYSCPDNSECINTIDLYKCLCLSGYKSSSDGLHCEEVFDQNGCNGEALVMGNLSRRLIGNIEENPKQMLSDSTIMSGWYRPIYNGRSFLLAGPGQNVTNGNCGTSKPILLQDPHPPMSSLTSELTVMKGCSLDTDGTCSNLQDIMVRRCGHEMQYYLDATIPYAAYCYEIQCVQGLYGENCEHECKCVKKNTAYCYPDIGDCECKPGWSGSTCNGKVTINANECASSGLNSCPDNSTCITTNGFNRCNCIPGFIRSVDGLKCMEGCDHLFYGHGCVLKCPCNVNNVVEEGEQCRYDDGKCFCKEGWTGFTCDVDIDECEDGSICKELNPHCANLPGSYRCDCIDGYIRTDNGHCIKDSEGNELNLSTVIPIVVANIIVLVCVVIVVKCWLGISKGNSIGSELVVGDKFREINTPLQYITNMNTENVYDQIADDFKRQTSSTTDYLHGYVDDKNPYLSLNHDELSRADYEYLNPDKSGYNGTPPKYHTSTTAGYM